MTCIDGDIGLRNLDVVLGLENRIVYDLVDVIEGRCRLRQAMIRDKRLSELYLIPAAQTRDKTAVSPSDMVRLCDELRTEVDWIIIDSPAGIERGFKNAVAAADRVLVMTNPEVSAVRDADRVIGLLEADGKGPASLIINRLNPTMVRRGDMLSVEDVLDLLAIDLIGIVPEDENVIVAPTKASRWHWMIKARLARLSSILHGACWGKKCHSRISIRRMCSNVSWGGSNDVFPFWTKEKRQQCQRTFATGSDPRSYRPDTRRTGSAQG